MTETLPPICDHCRNYVLHLEKYESNIIKKEKKFVLISKKKKR